MESRLRTWCDHIWEIRPCLGEASPILSHQAAPSSTGLTTYHRSDAKGAYLCACTHVHDCVLMGTHAQAQDHQPAMANITEPCFSGFSPLFYTKACGQDSNPPTTASFLKFQIGGPGKVLFQASVMVFHIDLWPCSTSHSALMWVSTI